VERDEGRCRGRRREDASRSIMARGEMSLSEDRRDGEWAYERCQL